MYMKYFVNSTSYILHIKCVRDGMFYSAGHEVAVAHATMGIGRTAAATIENAKGT